MSETATAPAAAPAAPAAAPVQKDNNPVHGLQVSAIVDRFQGVIYQKESAGILNII
jgi:hypothetical protein